MTAYIPTDSCTYLSPALRGWGRAPRSSMSKLIGLTKSLRPANHTHTHKKKQAQFILMGISKALKQMCIALSCFQTVQRVNKPNPGRTPHEVIALCQTNFLPSLNFQRPSRREVFASLTMNMCAFRCSCQRPSAVGDVKSLEERGGRLWFG